MLDTPTREAADTAAADDTAAERTRLALARPDLLREAAWIGGEWVTGAETITVRNPANGRAIGSIPALGTGETQAAVAAASQAFPAWAALTAKARGDILRRWFNLMLAHKTDLARLMTAEQGKPLAEAEGEIGYAAAFFEWFAEEGRRAYGDIIPGHFADRRLSVIKQPVGVVGAVTPWNFPAAMITRKVGPALAAGCTIVLKPSELTPFSALALAVLGAEAGVPAGVFNIVTGHAPPIGEVLTTDPRVRKFTFTGSTAVGKKLAAACMGTVKKVTMELGGNAPFIVFDDADLDAAVDGAIVSKFRNTGQTCVCANRFYVQAGIHDAFAKALAAKARTLRVGDGLDSTTDQGPLIDGRALTKVKAHVADALAGGATALAGGEALGGDFYQPTVLVGVAADALLAREETFGPVAGIVKFDTEAQAIALANGGEAGLAAYLYTRDADRMTRISEALEYGMVGLNTGLISTEVGPFGGWRESGLGREGSKYGLDEYLEMKFLVRQVAGS